MSKIYLTTDEWKIAKTISDKHNNTLREVGRLQNNIRHLQNKCDVLWKDLDEFDQSHKTFYDTLTEKYGVGDIDTDTGEFIKRENL
jgi:hypothetical protein